MTLITADGQKTGTTEVWVEWFFDNGHDTFARMGRTATRTNVGAAKRWAKTCMPVPQEDGDWWVRVQENRWETIEFDDPWTGEDVLDGSPEQTGVEWQGTIGRDSDGMPCIVWEDCSA